MTVNRLDTPPPQTDSYEPGLGRLFAPDPRDRSFAMAPPAREAARVEQRFWITHGPAYNQGASSMCVAYSGVRWLTTSPIKNKPLNFAELYTDCQRNDEWSGEEPAYFGTSVRALFRVLQRRGFVSEYRWAWDAETVVNHVLTIGPVVVGTDWLSGMDSVDAEGFIKAEGRNRGGHAYTIIGASRPRQAVRIINSWGAWGDKGSGRAWLSFSDLDRLIARQGEACTATEVRG